MAEFFVTNRSTDIIHGPGVNDRLNFTNQDVVVGFYSGPIWPSVDPTGYDGNYQSYLTYWCQFVGIEHFTFTDLVGNPDAISTGDGDDVFNGGGGDDQFWSGKGFDDIDGGPGTDYWTTDKSFVTDPIRLDLNKNSEYVTGHFARNVEGVDFTSGSGNDILIGHMSAYTSDHLRGGGGNDLLKLWTNGADEAEGGAGTDRLVVIAKDYGGTNTINFLADPGGGYKGTFDYYASTGVSFSGIENFTYVDLSDSADNIVTGDGDDIIKAGGGNDWINTGRGLDDINGGPDIDFWVADKSFITDDLKMDLNKVSNYAGHTVRNIEGMDFTSGSGNDTLIGSDSSNTNDHLRGGGGNDLLKLWTNGADEAEGGAGRDRLVVIARDHGGVETINFESSPGGGYKGTFDYYASIGISFSGIEAFTYVDKSSSDDSIVTGGGKDIIRGGGGNDWASSAGGKDRLFGGDGNDELRGGGGADKLFGGKGKDILFGGAGNDVSTGGPGADTFEFNAKGPSDGRDTIRDFQNGVDSLKVSGAVFSDLEIKGFHGGADTRVIMPDGTVAVLTGVSHTLIDDSDFVFV